MLLTRKSRFSEQTSCERENWWTKKEPHHVSREHGGNSKSTTTRINLWRGTASKRLAGWTRDGSTEEIASWTVEAQRLSKEVEAKKRKLQEAIERESTMNDVRMSDKGLDGLDGSLWS